MRIGIVTEYYRPWPGGITEHVHHEAEGLVRRGHEVSIITGPAKPGWVDDGVADVIRFPYEWRITHNGALSRMTLGPYLFDMRRRLKRLAFDVIHVHAPMDPFLGLWTLRAAQCALVGTFHANFDPGRDWDALFKTLGFFTRPAWESLHCRIAVSREASRSIGHYFPGHYEIIPNGVDTERFDPSAERLAKLEDGNRKILFVGRADPRKGLPMLLQAFREVRKRAPGTRLVVVGVERSEVESQLVSLGPDTVEAIDFEGYVKASDMPRYFASCDLFCSPANGQESQGIVLLEAMAAGRPPVAFAIPGYRDVIAHDVDGWLIDDIGVEPLAAGLCRLLNDEVRVKRLGEAGRTTALSYSWTSVVERIEAQMELAIERAAGRSPRV